MKPILISLAVLAASAPCFAQTVPFQARFDPARPATLQVQLKVGTQMQPATFTMDTGSVGIVLLASDLPANAKQEAPGPIKYTSSGVQWSGFWTTQPVAFMDGHGKVLATANVQVFAAQTPSCIGGGPNACNLKKVSTPHMMGIGFGRPDPYAFPARNPAIHVNGAAEQAYRIDQAGLTLGVPLKALASTCVQQPLKPNTKPGYQGDWMTPTGTLVLGGAAAPANILLDTGITDMLVGAASQPNSGALPGGMAITVGFMGNKLPLSYTVGTAPATPTAYKWIDYFGTNFVNTGITPLAHFVYYFNSTKGIAALCPL